MIESEVSLHIRASIAVRENTQNDIFGKTRGQNISFKKIVDIKKQLSTATQAKRPLIFTVSTGLEERRRHATFIQHNFLAGKNKYRNKLIK